RLLAVATTKSVKVGNKRLPRFDNFGLLRYGGSKLRQTRTGVEVSLRFVSTDSFHDTFDSNLPAKIRPIKHQRSARVLGKLSALAGLVIGVERETFRPERFQQDHARRHIA